MFYYIGSRSKSVSRCDRTASDAPANTPSARPLSFASLATVYSISLLSTLNAREGLRNSAEKFGHNSLRDLSSHSLSRQSVRAAIDPLLEADTTHLAMSNI